MANKKKQEVPLTFNTIKRKECKFTNIQKRDLLNFIKSVYTSPLIDTRNISIVNHIYLTDPVEFSKVIGNSVDMTQYYEVHISYQEQFDEHRTVVLCVNINDFNKYQKGTYLSPVRVLTKKYD